MRRALLALPLAFLLVLAGCSTNGALELDPVASAASKTTEAGSSRVAYEMKTTAAGRTLTLRGTGVFAHDELLGAMTMEIPSLLPGAGTGTLEVRLVGSTMYVRLPDLMAGVGVLPAGKKWFGVDLDKSLGAAGLRVLDMSQLQQDPTQTLRLLRASSTGVTKAGKATVRGVETTRYKATLDLEKVLTTSADELGLDAKQRKALRAAAKELRKQAGLGKVPVEVFVDADGLLRRYVMTMSTAAQGEQVKMSIATDFFDFGVDVDVQAPPAADVLDVTGQIPSAGG